MLADQTIAIVPLLMNLMFDESVYAVYDILRSVDPIIVSCYWTIFEYYEAILLYVDTLITWRKILYNIAHNLGEIYDLTYEIVMRFINWENNIEKVFLWDRVGWALGTMFNDVFMQPKDFEPYDHRMHDTDERRQFNNEK